MRNILLKYDFTGKFISRKTLPDNSATFTYYAELLDKDNLFLCFMINNRDNMAYSSIHIHDKDSITNWFSYDPIKINHVTPFSWFPMNKTPEGIHFVMPFSDTIYNYADSKVSPAYIIETLKPVPSKKDIPTSISSPYEIQKILGENGFFTGFTYFFETDNKIYLGHSGKEVLGFFLADKNKKEGKYYNLYAMPVKSEENKIQFFWHKLVSSYKNSFVAAVSPIDLLRDNYNLGDDDTSLAFKQLLKELDEEDNPVLFFYEFD